MSPLLQTLCRTGNCACLTRQHAAGWHAKQGFPQRCATRRGRKAGREPQAKCGMQSAACKVRHHRKRCRLTLSANPVAGNSARTPRCSKKVTTLWACRGHNGTEGLGPHAFPSHQPRWLAAVALVRCAVAVVLRA